MRKIDMIAERLAPLKLYRMGIQGSTTIDEIVSVIDDASRLFVQEKLPAPSQPVNAVTGELSDVPTDSVGPLPLQWMLIELDELTASHYYNGAVNPEYPQFDSEKEVQNRDRSKAGSQEDLGQIAAKFKPQFLLDSADIGAGAPIVIQYDGKTVVLSGNGRTIVLRRVYKDFQDKAGQYRETIETFLNSVGINGLKVRNMTRPVLVRLVAKTLTSTEILALAEEANQETKGGFSSVEQAKID